MNLTFYKWVMQFNLDDLTHPFADLAREMKYDKDFPDTTDTRLLLDYMDRKFTHLGAIKTFKNALLLYLLETDRCYFDIEHLSLIPFDHSNPFREDD